MSEEELIERLKQGDAQAFREFYDRYVQLIYRYIYLRLRIPQDSEDLTSETFIRAWRHISTFEWRENQTASWLLRIAHNLIVDKYRQKSPALSWLPWRSSPTRDEFEQVENRDEIQELFEKISAEEQIILYLHYFEDYTMNEVAAALGKTANAVTVAEFRALRRLRAAVKPEKPEISAGTEPSGSSSTALQ